jgi:hypothetical protein
MGNQHIAGAMAHFRKTSKSGCYFNKFPIKYGKFFTFAKDKGEKRKVIRRPGITDAMILAAIPHGRPYKPAASSSRKGKKSRVQNCWAVICPEQEESGLWTTWMNESCVAIGWSPPRNRMDGHTDDDGWARARKRLRKVAQGDVIIPYLQHNQFGTPGEVIRVAVSDADWQPTVEKRHAGGHPGEPGLGRRIHVKWLKSELPPEDTIAVVPRKMRYANGEVHQAIELLNPERYARFMEIIRNQANWKLYKPLAQNRAHTSVSNSEQFSDRLATKAIERVEEEIEKKAGFQPNPKIRKAVELHATRRAELEMQRRGYAVKDVSAKKPYDLFCEKKGECRYVEVKGTQGSGLDIVLTAGEVNFINENKSNRLLCVVHGIKVKGAKSPKASGGELQLKEPFNLSDGELRPIAFTFCCNKK